MKKVRLLDCTLRDGGRIIDCTFGQKSIRNIVHTLSDAKIDFVEVGFLRDKNHYEPGSTFFTDTRQIIPYLKTGTTTTFVAFADYGMFDFDTLPQCDGSSVTGIRLGFLHRDLKPALSAMAKVKDKGYKLFVQGINSLGYSDAEIITAIGSINELKPESFGIVDTYGAMYSENVEHLFSIVHSHLSEEIAIDFHSHNNFQLSFAHAQQMIRLCDGKRPLIIDCTLFGMGKEAGNLNSELIVEYLVRKKNAQYELDLLLDLIDDEIYPLANKEHWGYSIPALMSGVYEAHPNNVIYLTKKYKLNTKDIKNILSMIDDDIRKSYDYDVIEDAYLDYISYSIDDSRSIQELRDRFAAKKVLVLAPGKSLDTHNKEILAYIAKEKPVIITINFELATADNTYVFWSSQKRYSAFEKHNATTEVIISSNVQPQDYKEFVIDYSSITQRVGKHFENATIMALRLLQKMQIESLAIAGLDGFDESAENYAEGLAFSHARPAQEYAEINDEISSMLRQYIEGIEGDYPLFFLTPSRFEATSPKPANDQELDIRLLCMDVDGTLTDGSIYLTGQGEHQKRFDVKDGFGLSALAKAGIQLLLITGRTSEIVARRAEELGIDQVYQGIRDKLRFLDSYLNERQLTWDQVAYIGDDINDLECIKKVGFSACPSDAVKPIKDNVRYVCENNGGHGAVREVCEQLLPGAFR